MSESRQTDKWICCGGVVLMSVIAVAGYFLGNSQIALFGVTGFTAFSGPLFMAMNREMNNSNGNGAANGNGHTTSTEEKKV